MAKKIKRILNIFLIALFVLIPSAQSFAATIGVTPASATVTQGSTFSVSVRVDTQGKSVNVAEASISFPSDILQVVSVSPGSTFTLQTPGSPARTSSTAFFSAGVPSGYNGTNGLLGKITFKAIGTGSATIRVTSGKALLNDGNGTNGYTGGSSSTITITPVVPTEKPVTPVVTPPVIAPTTPEQPGVPEIIPSITPDTQDPNIVTTITIRVSDLITVIYILLALLLIFIILTLILWRKNIKLAQELRDSKEIPPPPVIKSPRKAEKI